MAIIGATYLRDCLDFLIEELLELPSLKSFLEFDDSLLESSLLLPDKAVEEPSDIGPLEAPVTLQARCMTRRAVISIAVVGLVRSDRLALSL